MGVVTPRTVGPVVVQPREVGTSPGGSGPNPPPTVMVTLPPVSWEISSHAAREGVLGSTLAGRHWLLGSTHYVDVVHNGQDIDSAVAGRTRIVVTLGSGNHTGTQHATAAASAITSAGFTVEQDGDTLTITGASSAADGAVSYEECGTRRVYGIHHDSGGTNGASISTFRVCCLRAGVLPDTGIIRINGAAIRRGTAATQQLQLAVYQGGTRGSPDSNVVFRGRIGVTVGTTGNTMEYVHATTPITVDLADGPIWIGWMGAGTGADQTVVSTNNQVQATASDFHNNTGAQPGIWVMSGGPSGAAGTFPAAFGTVGSSFNFLPYIHLVVEHAPFQTSTEWVRPLGTLHPTTFTGTGGVTTSNTLLVANAYIMPNLLGLRLTRFGICYATHVSGQDYRLAYAEGGSAANNMFGAFFHDVGQTSGTDTGWNDLDCDIPVTPGGRSWLTVRCNFGGIPGSSTMSFENGAGANMFTPVNNPARYFGGNTTESEFVAASPTFTPTTNISFDPAVPLEGVVEPNGDNINTNNCVGVRGRLRIPGIVVG